MREATPRRAGRLLAAALGAAALLLAAPVRADESSPRQTQTGARDAVRAGAALMEAKSPRERECLTDASWLRVRIINDTGRQPQQGSYAPDFARIVEACQAGLYDLAADRMAVIWAGIALHQPHKS